MVHADAINDMAAQLSNGLVFTHSDESVRTGSVLFLSRPRSEVWPPTPSTYFLHLFLSYVILIDSSTQSSVHVLMLSIQAVCDLPRLLAPGIVPCIISFSRLLPLFLMV